MKNIPLYVCHFIVSFALSQVNAAVLFQEDFSGYTSGESLNGQTSPDFSNNWDVDGTAVAASVNFNVLSSGLTYSNGGYTLGNSPADPATSSVSAFRSNTRPAGGDPKTIQVQTSSHVKNLATDVWMSALVYNDGTTKVGSALIGFTISSDAAFDSINNRAFGIGIKDNNLGAYHGNGGWSTDFAADGIDILNVQDSSLALITGVNFVVAKISDASPDTMTVWLNPALDGGTPSGGTSITIDGNGMVSGNTSWGINSLFLSHDYGDATETYDSTLDELRIGESFSDVAPSFTAVPEPSTYALLFGIGALGFVVYRRRK